MKRLICLFRGHDPVIGWDKLMRQTYNCVRCGKPVAPDRCEW